MINGGIFKTRKRHKSKEESEELWKSGEQATLLWAANEAHG